MVGVDTTQSRCCPLSTLLLLLLYSNGPCRPMVHCPSRLPSCQPPQSNVYIYTYRYTIYSDNTDECLYYIVHCILGQVDAAAHVTCERESSAHASSLSFSLTCVYINVDRIHSRIRCCHLVFGWTMRFAEVLMGTLSIWKIQRRNISCWVDGAVLWHPNTVTAAYSQQGCVGLTFVSYWWTGGGRYIYIKRREKAAWAERFAAHCVHTATIQRLWR